MMRCSGEDVLVMGAYVPAVLVNLRTGTVTLLNLSSSGPKSSVEVSSTSAKREVPERPYSKGGISARGTMSEGGWVRFRRDGSVWATGAVGDQRGREDVH